METTSAALLVRSSIMPCQVVMCAAAPGPGCVLQTISLTEQHTAGKAAEEAEYLPLCGAGMACHKRLLGSPHLLLLHHHACQGTVDKVTA